MIFNFTYQRALITAITAFMCLLLVQKFGFAAKKRYVMTEVELQPELMSYADRFASIITQALEDFETLNPTSQARQVILIVIRY